METTTRTPGQYIREEMIDAAMEAFSKRCPLEYAVIKRIKADCGKSIVRIEKLAALCVRYNF